MKYFWHTLLREFNFVCIVRSLNCDNISVYAVANWKFIQPYNLTSLQPDSLTFLQPYSLTTLQPCNPIQIMALSVRPPPVQPVNVSPTVSSTSSSQSLACQSSSSGGLPTVAPVAISSKVIEGFCQMGHPVGLVQYAPPIYVQERGNPRLVLVSGVVDNYKQTLIHLSLLFHRAHLLYGKHTSVQM